MDTGGRSGQCDPYGGVFSHAAKGWAVGHDGVVLHTSDGGESWRMQLDGNQANA